MEAYYKKSVVSLNIEAINKYFNLGEEELFSMSLSEVIFLHEEAENLRSNDERTRKMKEDVPYWKQFLEPYLTYLIKAGFNEQEIELEMTKYSARKFYSEESFRKGQKPYTSKVHVKLDKEGKANFPVPKTRSNRTEYVDADFYHVSQVDKYLLRDLMMPLIKKKYPFLNEFKFTIYGFELTEEDGQIKFNDEFYINLSGTDSSLYVPIQAIINCDKQLVIDRQNDYFGKWQKKTEVAEKLLNHPDTLLLFEYMDNLKVKLYGEGEYVLC